MTPGDPTEPMTQSGSTQGSTAPTFPRRPEDVNGHRARVKAEKAAQKEAQKEAGASRSTAAAPSLSSAPARADASARSTSTAAAADGHVGSDTTVGGGGTAVRPAAKAPALPVADRPAARPAPSRPATSSGGRRVRLTLSRIDPWSALKMSFLLSVALGIAMVVAVAALWLLLKGMGAFDQVNNLVGSIIQDGDKKFDIMDFVGFGRVVSLSIVFAVIDVFLFTAIATLGAFIYNVSASLVGGLGLTLTDD